MASTSPRTRYLAGVEALRTQVTVLEGCDDPQELIETSAEIRRILDELEGI
ncbi:hypothetical protein [Brachybacterium tyrofermentans]|uniref:hypothetical protein n=1 Tax=Brachybacterium tyrofermentans TaxID=47848 RepID=UPI003FD345B8